MKFTDLRVVLRVKQPDKIAEVRDPETDELVDHLWAPQPDEELDLSDHVVSYRLEPKDIEP